MSKPHIKATYMPKLDCVIYIIYDDVIYDEDNIILFGATWINSDGAFCKSDSLSFWLNNPENVKKYLKTPINPNNTELTAPTNYLDIGDSFSKQYINTKQAVRKIGWRNI